MGHGLGKESSQEKLTVLSNRVRPTDIRSQVRDMSEESVTNPKIKATTDYCLLHTPTANSLLATVFSSISPLHSIL